MGKGISNKGMTLIETMIAMALFASITFTANSFLIGAIGANKKIENLAKATEIGNKVLENIRTMPYETILNDRKVIESRYDCSWLVTTDGSTKMKQIILTVSWPIREPKHTIELSTIIAE